jgi:hypothetical protein
MRVVLGTPDDYYDQKNNATVYFTEDYGERKRIVACGPESVAMGLDIAGRDMSIFTPGVQPGDGITMLMHNPKNLPALRARRKLNYNTYPPNEVPQLYDVVGRILYKEDAILYKRGLSFKIARANILNKIPFVICGDFPAGGHYALGVGFDDDGQKIIYNDPYDIQYINKNGYNRELTPELKKQYKIKNWRIDIYPPTVAL